MAKVILISHTPNPEHLVATAARLCYSPVSIEELGEKITDESAGHFVEMLAELGHESPVEHVSFTFGIEGVSRALLAQITRHRMASYSVQSQRYVTKNDFDYIVPPEIAADPGALDEFHGAMAAAGRYYVSIAGILKDKYTAEYIEAGHTDKEASRMAEKRAIEDARFVLPNACDTRLIMTANARSLLNFFRHRCCNRAQWEIRRLAEDMLTLVLQVAPALFSRAGPACISGPCSEGKMSCGQMQQVRAHFESLRRKARQ